MSYETVSVNKKCCEKTIVVSLHNDGSAYISHSFENVSLINTSISERYELPKNLEHWRSYEITISYIGDTTPIFRLENVFGCISAESDYVPSD